MPFFLFFKKERYFTLSDSLVTDFLLVKIVPDDVYQFDNGERCLLTPGGALKASPNPKLRWTNPETQKMTKARFNYNCKAASFFRVVLSVLDPWNRSLQGYSPWQ